MLALVDDKESAKAGTALVVKVLGNDSVTRAGGASRPLQLAYGGAAVSVAVESAPAHGSAKVDGSSVVYTAAPGYAGEDEFTYRVDVKGTGTLTGTAVVRITVAAPVPTSTPTPKAKKPRKPAPAKSDASGGSSTGGGGGGGSTYYKNCTAVRAAGADPIRSGDPGYGRHLDRDGDGVACE
ncbi:excalibur calcium-binding domain-containing protein [Streptomyces sp. NPDC004609]|uniref:excalibur calcium-binding domain-containing protein n=1 Tax=Streptomyces sp. NPDC004609 TaxID=3364704 RepID=UPI0036CA26E8